MINLLCVAEGLDRIGYDMLEQLSYRDFRVYITSFTGHESQQMPGKCERITIPPFHSKFSIPAIRALRQAIRKHRIEIIYSVSSAGLSNALFASWSSGALNVGYRGTMAKVRRSDPTYYLGLLNPRVKHVVCANRDIYTYLSRFFPENQLTVNVKPFRPEWIEQARETPRQIENIPSDAFKIIYIANTKGRPHKGLSVLIRAMELLPSCVHLVFIGNYGDEDATAVKKSPAFARIHFTGEREDAVYYLSSQDLFVLPSLRDASPRTVREAMACGLPCVIADIPGARDLVVKDRTARLAAPGSPESLADNIRFFIDHPEACQTYGRAGLEHLLKDFSPEHYVDTFDRTFHRLIEENRIRK